MPWFLIRYHRENPLGRRVLTAILLCSTCLAFLATGAQLLLDYRHDVSAIELRMSEIESSYLDSIGSAMWDMNDQQLRRQTEGVAKLPDIAFAQISDPTGKILMTMGALPRDKFKTLVRRMPIMASQDPSAKNKKLLGEFVVAASLDRTYADLKGKALFILVTQTTKTTIVAIFTLFIFNRLVSRHLSTLATYAGKLDLNNLGQPLALARRAPRCKDELDVVVAAINEMGTSIGRDVEELAKYRKGLEDLVKSRTEDLARKVAELELVIRRLNREVEERELAERAVRENEERYRQVVEMSPDAIMIERDGRIVFANGGTAKLLGAGSVDQVLDMPLLAFVPADWHEIVHDQMRSLESHPAQLRPFEGKLTRFDGATVDVEISRALFQYAGVPAIQTVAHDITKHKHYEEQLRKQALHDGLTGLPNRTLLMDRLNQAIAQAERAKHRVFLLFFDLDRFKCINDTLGHDAGDELLKIVTARMSECVRKCDTLARLGGDEFVLLLGNVVDEDAMSKLIERILARLSEPMMLGQQEVAITTSIGISVYPQDGNDAITLLKNADTAMYRAKEQGRNGAQRYCAELHAREVEHLSIDAGLRRAIERKEFLLYYQPQVDLRSGRIIGAEALVRWQHPELGLVLPARFIPVAEQTGLIERIGSWVIAEACRQAMVWRAAGLPPIRIAVNLSAQQLVRPTLEAEVGDVLSESGLPPECLELEITESMSMNDPQLTGALLTKLKATGVSVAIDDFGTGYSNLAHLKRFPVDRLKLDRSFVRDIGTDKTDAELVNAIICLAHNLRLTVIAEGVEDADQLRQLIAYGCDEMQGYYFSPPLPAAEFARFLGEGNTLDLSPRSHGCIVNQQETVVCTN